MLKFCWTTAWCRSTAKSPLEYQLMPKFLSNVGLHINDKVAPNFHLSLPLDFNYMVDIYILIFLKNELATVIY